MDSGGKYFKRNAIPFSSNKRTLLFIYTASQDANTLTTDPQEIIKEPFSLEEIYEGRYYSFGFHDEWFSDTEIMIKDLMYGVINVHDVTTGQKTVIFEHQTLPVSCNFS